MWACRKNEAPETIPPPVTLEDTAFQITTVTKTDINEYDLSFLVKPNAGETYDALYLSWSTTPDFSLNKDSILIASGLRSTLSSKYSLNNLKQGSSYYARLVVKYNTKTYFSKVREWKVDSLRITMVFHTSLFPVVALRGTNVHIRTNAGADTTKMYNVGTKVSIGPYACPLTLDKGAVVYFDIPKTIPPGRYSLKLERKGMAAQTPDSVYVYIGFWNSLPTPNITVNSAQDINNSVIDYGSCQSATKAYIIGGINIHPVTYTSFNNERSRSLLEFNAATNGWTTRAITNPHSFENPNTFYHNNGVYVIGGMEEPYSYFFGSRQTIRNVWRLDLSSMAWSIVDTVPYATRYDPVSFELNGEWYIGLGTDSANRSQCCGDPLPDKDFWKYSPTMRTWTRIADFPGSHQTFPTTFSIGSKAYVFLGDLGESNHELWQYDPAANAWESIQLPAGNEIPRGEKYSIVAYKGKIYFLTGQVRTLFVNGYGHSVQNSFVEYNPVTKEVNKINNNYNLHLGMVKPIYQNGSRIVFQSNVFGYIQSMPVNKTTELLLE